MRQPLNTTAMRKTLNYSTSKYIRPEHKYKALNDGFYKGAKGTISKKDFESRLAAERPEPFGVWEDRFMAFANERAE